MRFKNNKILYSLLFGFFLFGVSHFTIEAQAQEVNPVEQVQTIDNQEDLSLTSETNNSTTESNDETQDASVSYETHVQDIGWQGEKQEGEVAGTTGQSKRVEALQIQLENSPYEGQINYQTHVQNIGWQSAVSDGQIAGTTGQSYRLEALKIWLSGDVSNYYSIQYRVHVQDIGWQDWVCDGLTAGTTGLSKRIEALQIRLIRFAETDPEIQYQPHQQDVGWKQYASNGDIAGSVGQSKQLEAIRINLNQSKYSGDVRYQVHVQDIGWQDWVSNGAMAGTTGQSKGLQAIRILLNGDISDQYSVYYRVHSSSYGWLDWVKDGLVAGTTGLSKAFEAIQIFIVNKFASVQLDSNSEVASIVDKIGYDKGSIVTGWKSINGNYYYFDENGKLAIKQTINKDGRIGYVNSYGCYIPSNNGIYMEGIDISEHNGDIDLSQYTNNFVIIRLGYYYDSIDKKAIRNIQLCEQLGIPYGVYLYSYATNVNEAAQEAYFTLNLLSQYCSNVRVGVWYDMEDADNYKANRGALVGSLMTDMCNTYCNIIRNAGYFTGVYSSSWWFSYYLSGFNSTYAKWVANWGTNDGTLQTRYDSLGVLHQYTSKPLDKSVMYVPLDYFKL